MSLSSHYDIIAMRCDARATPRRLPRGGGELLAGAQPPERAGGGQARCGSLSRAESPLAPTARITSDSTHGSYCGSAVLKVPAELVRRRRTTRADPMKVTRTRSCGTKCTPRTV